MSDADIDAELVVTLAMRAERVVRESGTVVPFDTPVHTSVITSLVFVIVLEEFS